jgi:predicted ATP-grasp superfamily ATP-dependent carboligase
VAHAGLAGSVVPVSALRWTQRPDVDQPVIVVAFEGWNDAGEAASHAVAYLASRWDATEFVTIDPEEFYDFTVTRPQTRIVDGDVRAIDWPTNSFSLARPEGSPAVVLLSGVEPQLKWRTFCGHVIEVAEVLDARLVLTLGALLADVPHSRPTSVFGTAYDRQVMDALDLEPSQYEGPTGIVGVLHAECFARDIHSASLWAAVPSYVAAAPSPKAAHALVERVCELLGTDLGCDDLTDASNEYERQISDLVAEDPETEAYVQHLEETHDSDEHAVASLDELVAEVERFLRDH